jgi:hypothetical protein
MKGIGKPKEEMFDVVHKELMRRYPKHVWKNKVWHFFNAGGWVIVIGKSNLTPPDGIFMLFTCKFDGIRYFVWVTHPNLWYILYLLGVFFNNSGHSGRYPLEVHDYVMMGEYMNQMEQGTGIINRTTKNLDYLFKIITFINRVIVPTLVR